MEFLFWNNYFFTIQCFDIKSFDKLNEYHSQYNPSSNYPIHMKGIQTEHLLNSKPTYNLCFYKGHSKNNPNNHIFKIVPKWSFLFCILIFLCHNKIFKVQLNTV